MKDKTINKKPTLVKSYTRIVNGKRIVVKSYKRNIRSITNALVRPELLSIKKTLKKMSYKDKVSEFRERLENMSYFVDKPRNRKNSKINDKVEKYKYLPNKKITKKDRMPKNSNVENKPTQK